MIRSIVVGVLVLAVSLVVAANVMAILIAKVPLVRDDARVGQGTLALVAAGSLAVGVVVWNRLRRR